MGFNITDFSDFVGSTYAEVSVLRVPRFLNHYCWGSCLTPTYYFMRKYLRANNVILIFPEFRFNKKPSQGGLFYIVKTKQRFY